MIIAVVRLVGYHCALSPSQLRITRPNRSPISWTELHRPAALVVVVIRAQSVLMTLLVCVCVLCCGRGAITVAGSVL